MSIFYWKGLISYVVEVLCQIPFVSLVLGFNFDFI